jgi:hypothetical protein
MNSFGGFYEMVSDDFFDFEARLMAPVPGAVDLQMCWHGLGFQLSRDRIAGPVNSFREFAQHCHSATIF